MKDFKLSGGGGHFLLCSLLAWLVVSGLDRPDSLENHQFPYLTGPPPPSPLHIPPHFALMGRSFTHNAHFFTLAPVDTVVFNSVPHPIRSSENPVTPVDTLKG